MSDTYRPSGYLYRNFKQDSDHLFNHLIDLRRAEPPDSLVERFRYLFVEGAYYPEPEILRGLHRIANSTWADDEFTLILNRCCYILINFWWLQPELREATIELVELFKHPCALPKSSAAARRVRELVYRFTQTDQYAVLQDRARTVAAAKSASSETDQPLRNLIPRYPFLYPYCLLNWDSSEGGQEAVHQLQEAKERQFEQNLNRYLWFLMRRSRDPDARGNVSGELGNGNSTRKGTALADPVGTVENPTLLDPEQLKAAVQKFVGKDENGNTYRDSARQFASYSRAASSYRELKQQIYEYLTDSIQHSCNPGYGKHYFNRWLEDCLADTFPQNDNVRPTNLLLVQTCARLVELLVASPTSRSKDQLSKEHLMFIDLNNNLGATFTIGLLLKLALICQDLRANWEAMKAHMSRRFAIMLKHYETKVKHELEWLVECLENLLVGFSVHSGRTDFSWVNLAQR
jgi:hypothetical protein